VLKVEEVEKPTPTDKQVLVKVKSASINAGDWRGLENPILARAIGGGLFKPKKNRIGSDVAGEVVATGENLTRFKPGDEVFGCASGAFAEYALSREDNLTLKPSSISFEQAAAVPVAGLTALQAIRYAGGIRPGQKVLIQGASGGVGIYAVELARSHGADVTAVCSTKNLEMVRSIGADRVIDYTREDFTRNGQAYDLILAVNGYHSLPAYKRALSAQGVYVCVGGALPQIFQSILLGSWMSRNGEKKMSNMGIAKVNKEDLAHLAELLNSGMIVPIIDRIYPLSEIVDAMRYVLEKHAQGKVVISMEKSN
jgi:NADPH:quinone reductase-like Zn-dependent oxidoreductase